jgi:hypothetical protein
VPSSESKAVPVSPSHFQGTLAELTEKYLCSVMPEASSVESIHRHLKAYCKQEAPLLLLRYEKIADRCTDLTMPNGAIIRWTDNSPAWEIHHAAFQGLNWSTAEFDTFVRTIPCKMFGVKNSSINKSKWYVAHMFPVKADRCGAGEMTHAQRISRFIRNVHPANHFYFPSSAKGVGRLYGEDPRVISYMAAYCRSRYAAVWPEFLELARAEDFLVEDSGLGDLLIDFHSGVLDIRKNRSTARTRVPMDKANLDELCKVMEGDYKGDLNWTGNDTSARNQSGVIPGNLISVTLRLCWRVTQDLPERFIGCYRLNLGGLEAAGYIRRDEISGKYRVRIVHDSDNDLYLQLNSKGPRILLGRFV